MADGRATPIEKIRYGAWVWSPVSHNGRRVVKVMRGPELHSLYHIWTDAHEVSVTEDHPFLTEQGWIQVRALKKGQFIVGDGEKSRVVKVRKMPIKKGQEVWNITLEGDDENNHIVIANGIPTGDLEIQVKLKRRNFNALRKVLP